MRVHGLGHVVLKVRSLARSVPFYRDVLGLKKVGQLEDKMVFFSVLDNHHDVALLEVGEDAPDAPDTSPGLAHVAFKVGDSLAELQEAKDWLVEHGVQPERLRDHLVSQSVYFRDPDGHQIEVFVDGDPAVWHANPQTVATSNVLRLE
jgi:catechol 2,3-dioxygenase